MRSALRVVRAPPAAHGWKPDRGWLVRTKTRGGAEKSEKYDTYQDARREALRLVFSRGFREVWVEEVGVVKRAWRDLEIRDRPASFEERKHVLAIEEEDA